MQETELKIKIDSKQIKTANNLLDTLAKKGAKAGSSSDKLSMSTKRLNNNTTNLNKSLLNIPTALTAIGTAMGVNSFIKYADEMTQVNSKLKLVTNSTTQLNSVQEKLFATSQESRVSFTETIDLYSRIGRSTKQLTIEDEKLLQVTENISKSLIISGGSAESAKSALVQLGQGFASGTLRGQELNSIMEQTPRLATAIADGMGITIGKLREYGAQGKITSKILVDALYSQTDAVQKEFLLMSATVGQAGEVVNNSLTKSIGLLDDSLGLTKSLSSNMIALAKSMDTIDFRSAGEMADTIKALAVTVGTLYIGTKVLGTTTLIYDSYLKATLITTKSYSVATNISTISTTRMTIAQQLSLVTTRALSFALKSIPFVAVSVGVFALADSFFSARTESDELDKSLSQTSKSLSVLTIAQLDLTKATVNKQLITLREDIRDAEADVKTSALWEDEKDIKTDIVHLETLQSKYSRLQKTLIKIGGEEKRRADSIVMNKSKEAVNEKEITTSIQQHLSIMEKQAELIDSNIKREIELAKITTYKNKAILQSEFDKKKINTEYYTQALNLEDKLLTKNISRLKIENKFTNKKLDLQILEVKANAIEDQISREKELSVVHYSQNTLELEHLLAKNEISKSYYDRAIESEKQLHEITMSSIGTKETDLGIESNIDDYAINIKLDGFDDAHESLMRLSDTLTNIGLEQEEFNKYSEDYNNITDKSATDIAKFDKAKITHQKNEIKGYGNILGASSKLFKENSKEAKALLIAQKVLSIATGITAIATAMTGDPYTAIPRALAVASTLASFGWGGSGGSAPKVPDYTATIDNANFGSSLTTQSGVSIGDYSGNFEKFIEGIDNASEKLNEFGSVGSALSGTITALYDSIADTKKAIKGVDVRKKDLYDLNEIKEIKPRLQAKYKYDSKYNVKLRRDFRYSILAKRLDDTSNKHKSNLVSLQKELTNAIVETLSEKIDYSLLDNRELQGLLKNFDLNEYNKILDEVNYFALKAKEQGGNLTQFDKDSLRDIFTSDLYIIGKDYEDAINLLEKNKDKYISLIEKDIEKQTNGLIKIYDNISNFTEKIEQSLFGSSLDTSASNFDKSFSDLVNGLKNNNSNIADLSSDAISNATKYLEDITKISTSGKEEDFAKAVLLNQFESINLSKDATINDLVSTAKDLLGADGEIVKWLETINQTTYNSFSDFKKDIDIQDAYKQLELINNPVNQTSTIMPARPIPKFANGGIVTSPIVGLIGEAGYNEAVIPLKDPNDPLGQKEVILLLKNLYNIGISQLGNSKKQLQTQRFILDEQYSKEE